MTTKKVLANIYYFATEILQTAHLKTNWSETSIRRAFQWSTYCVKVCDINDGCPEKEVHLNAMLEEVFCASADWTGPVITVKMLKNSSDILCQSLLQNPALKESDRTCIIKSYMECGRIQELIKGCAELAMLKAGVTLVLEALNQNSLVDYGLTDLQLAGGWLKEALPSQPVGSDELLWQRLELLGSSHLALLLELLVDKSNSLLNQELQQSILQWLLHHTRCGVWQVAPTLLSRVAATHLPFYKAYIQFLVTEVAKLQPSYTKSAYHWVVRLDSPSSLKYIDIVSHFQELCGRSELLAQLTTQIITEHAMKSTSSIWLDIHSDIHANKKW